jgi:hypothetical protein
MRILEPEPTTVYKNIDPLKKTEEINYGKK